MREVNVKVRLTRDTNLWAFDADKWADIKPVKAFKKGDILDVAGVATNALGGVYYLTPYSFDKKIANGFNKVDCEIIEI